MQVKRSSELGRIILLFTLHSLCAANVSGRGDSAPKLRSSDHVGFPEKKLRNKYLTKTVFLGQLPYTTTQDQLHLFFARRNIHEVTVRMLTDKKTGTFRGMAFVDFLNEKDAEKALKMDHGLLAGRRIRIERTAAGGGNKPKRKARILRAKQTQDADKRKGIVEMIDRIFLRQDARASQALHAATLMQDPTMHASRRVQVEKVSKHPVCNGELFKREDVDDELINALCTLPDKIARKAIKICSRLEVSTVRNRGAYAIGVIKKRLRKAERKARRKRAAARAKQENEVDVSAADDEGASGDNREVDDPEEESVESSMQEEG